MANRVKGEARLELGDGREFVLCMDFDMRVQVEELCDKPFMEVAQKASAGFHGAIRALLWGALQRHHADLSMEEITALIEDHGEELEAAMTKAAEAASPPEDAEGKKPGNRRARRATKTSGGNGAKPG